MRSDFSARQEVMDFALLLCSPLSALTELQSCWKFCHVFADSDESGYCFRLWCMQAFPASLWLQVFEGRGEDKWFFTRSSRVDVQVADIWSCGVMLYVMLVGAYPFERPEDKTDNQKLQKMIQVSFSTGFFMGLNYSNLSLLPQVSEKSIADLLLSP